MISIIQWNDVKKSLPNVDVLVLTNLGLSCWDGKIWRRGNSRSGSGVVTHWAEVPAPVPTQLSPIGCIVTERTKQDAKWGEQNHDNLGWLAILAEEFGEAAKCVTESSVNHSKDNSWRTCLEHELIQTAAVCVAWLECIRKREQVAEMLERME